MSGLLNSFVTVCLLCSTVLVRPLSVLPPPPPEPPSPLQGSNHVQRKLKERSKGHKKLDTTLADQFNTGRLYACISRWAPWGLAGGLCVCSYGGGGGTRQCRLAAEPGLLAQQSSPHVPHMHHPRVCVCLDCAAPAPDCVLFALPRCARPSIRLVTLHHQHSRPGQCGRCDGYILEGRELEFYVRKMQKKKKGTAAA